MTTIRTGKRTVVIREGDQRITVSAGGGGGDGDGRSVTREIMRFPVDYNDVGAVDPPVGTIFTTQTQIDSFLAANSATSFKHLQAVFDAIPKTILHTPEIDLAVGVHRPQVGFTSPNFASWDWDEKIIPMRVGCNVNGVSPANYPALPGLGGLTVTGQQVGSGDPWIDVSGTPFVAGDLKGRYAVTDSGQVLVIHDNTMNRVFVSGQIAPVPTTVTIVATTGTILRNAQTDTAGAAQNFFGMSISVGQLYLHDITIDSWSSPFGTALAIFGKFPFDSTLAFSNIMIDRRSYFDITGQPDAQGTALLAVCDSIESDFVTMTNLSILPPPSRIDDATDFAFSLTTANYNFTGFYAGLSDFGGVIGGTDPGRATSLIVTNAVFDDMVDGAQATANLGVINVIGISTFFAPVHFGSGKINTFRDMASPSQNPGVIGLREGAKIGADQAFGNFKAVFSGNAADCINVGLRCDLMKNAFTDGGGNTGFGIVVNGPFAHVDIDSGTTITGAAGDVSISGAVKTYAQIVAASPVVDLGRFNQMTKI